MHREHPVKILRYCTVNLWLLLFPLIRSLTLIPFSPEALAEWISGAWMDIIIMLFIFSTALLKWRSCLFRTEKNCFVITRGILIQKKVSIPYEKITSAKISEIRLPFILRLSFLRIDTSAGNAGGSTVLWLRTKNLMEISNAVPVCSENSRFLFSCKSSLWKVVLYSFMFSSSISGTLYIAAFFIEAKNAAGEILNRLRIPDAINEMSSAASSVFHAVPKIIIIILIILLLCRFLSFSVNLLRSAGFCTFIGRDKIRILSGVFPRHNISIYTGKAECLIRRHSIIGKIAGVSSLFITYPGNFKEKNKGTLLIPVTADNSLFMSKLSKGQKNKVSPGYGTLWCFIWQPVTIICIILALLLLLSYIKTGSAEILFPLSVIALVPAALLLFIRLIAFKSQYTAYDGNTFSVCSGRRLSFLTLSTDIKNIAFYKKTETPMAKKQGYCNMTIYIKGNIKAVLRGYSEKNGRQFYI
ncbi:MAG: PH domain-containing protein [Ruminococcus sp.]